VTKEKLFIEKVCNEEMREYYSRALAIYVGGVALLWFLLFVVAVPAQTPDWKLLTADAGGSTYYFDTESIVPAYPGVMVDLQVRRKGSAARVAAVNALADCVKTEAVGFNRYIAYDKRGKGSSTAIPASFDMERVGSKLRERLCRRSGPPRPSERWVPMGSIGKNFEMAYQLVDSDSMRIVGGDVTFWTRQQPEYPLVYGLDLKIFAFSQLEDFEYLLFRESIDCVDRTIMTHYMASYTRDGKMLGESADRSHPDAKPIKPDSDNEKLMKHVCQNAKILGV